MWRLFAPPDFRWAERAITIPKCGSPAPREYGRTDLKADVTLLAFHWTPQVIAPLGEEDDHAQSGKYM
jgi:hypothetical protein